MNSKDVNSFEGRKSLLKALGIEKRFIEAREMSGRITDVVLRMNLTGIPNANFVRAKRLMHEILNDHYVVLHGYQQLPAEIENDTNVSVRYRSLQYDFLIDLLMVASPDMYHFNLVNLATEDSVDIAFSDADIQHFITHTSASIHRREEKFDDVHIRLRNFLKGKKSSGSRSGTPITNPDQVPQFPVYWPTYNLIMGNPQPGAAQQQAP